MGMVCAECIRGLGPRRLRRLGRSLGLGGGLAGLGGESPPLVGQVLVAAALEGSRELGILEDLGPVACGGWDWDGQDGTFSASKWLSVIGGRWIGGRNSLARRRNRAPLGLK